MKPANRHSAESRPWTVACCSVGSLIEAPVRLSDFHVPALDFGIHAEMTEVGKFFLGNRLSASRIQSKARGSPGRNGERALIPHAKYFRKVDSIMLHGMISGFLAIFTERISSKIK